MGYIGNTSYHLKDSFFNIVNDDKLMKNKEDGQYRPHFFCFQDSVNPNILWAIPQSTKTGKFHRLYNDKVSKFGFCNTIRFGDFAGKENAFLIQNMFPIIPKYIDHEHTIGGQSVKLQTLFVRDLIQTAKQVLALHRRGKRLIFPDIDKIYALMLSELEEEQK